MFEKFLRLISLSCRHKHTSQPFAAASSTSPPPAGGEWESIGDGPSHYLVCLDCGKKIPYDWANMRRIG